MISTQSLLIATLLLNAASSLAAPVRITRAAPVSVEASVPRAHVEVDSTNYVRIVDKQMYPRGPRSRTFRRSRLATTEEPEALRRDIEVRDDTPVPPAVVARSHEPQPDFLPRKYPRRVYYNYYEGRAAEESDLMKRCDLHPQICGLPASVTTGTDTTTCTSTTATGTDVTPTPTATTEGDGTPATTTLAGGEPTSTAIVPEDTTTTLESGPTPTMTAEGGTTTTTADGGHVTPTSTPEEPATTTTADGGQPTTTPADGSLTTTAAGGEPTATSAPDVTVDGTGTTTEPATPTPTPTDGQPSATDRGGEITSSPTPAPTCTLGNGTFPYTASITTTLQDGETTIFTVPVSTAIASLTTTLPDGETLTLSVPQPTPMDAVTTTLDNGQTTTITFAEPTPTVVGIVTTVLPDGQTMTLDAAEPTALMSILSQGEKTDTALDGLLPTPTDTSPVATPTCTKTPDAAQRRNLKPSRTTTPTPTPTLADRAADVNERRQNFRPRGAGPMGIGGFLRRRWSGGGGEDSKAPRSNSQRRSSLLDTRVLHARSPPLGFQFGRDIS